MHGWLGIGVGAFAGLEVLALIAGIGITALGPGGVLIPIGLITLTHLSKGQIAGTAIVTQVGTGLLGSLAYRRSAQLRDPATLRTAGILAGAAIIGAPLGVLLNSVVSRGLFGVLLGAFVGATGVLVWVRARQSPTGAAAGGHPDLPSGLIAGLGFGVAVVSGLFGLGGPLLSVPLLVAAGLPLLSALASAQVQSIVLASAGAITYLARGDIEWRIALAVLIPQLIGVVIGWRIARRVPTARLMRVLAVVLVALAPYLILR
jgi:uncharacterized membrane protein YfcA